MDRYLILTLLLLFGYVAHAAVPTTSILADQNNVQFPNYQTERGAVKAGMGSYWFASGGFDYNYDIYNYNNNVMFGSVADNYLSVTTWDSENKFTSVNGKTSFNTANPVTATGVFPNGNAFVGFGHAGNFAGFTQNFVTSSLYTQGQSFTLTSENVVNSAVNYALKLFAIADTNGFIKVYNMNTFVIVVEISSADYSLGAKKIKLTPAGIYADTYNPIDGTRGVYFKQYTSTGFSSTFQHKVYSKNKLNSGVFSTTSDGTVLAVVSADTNELVFYQYEEASDEFTQFIYASSYNQQLTEYFTMTDDGTVFIAQSDSNGRRSNGYKRANSTSTPGPTTGSSTNNSSTPGPTTGTPGPTTGQPTTGNTVRPTSAPTSSSSPTTGTVRPTSPGTTSSSSTTGTVRPTSPGSTSSSSTTGGSGTTNPTSPSTTGSSSGGGGGYIGGPSQLKVLKYDPITNTWIDSEILNLRGNVYYINSAGSGDVIVKFTSSFTSAIWIRNVVVKVPAPTPTLYFSATSAEATIGYGLPNIDIPYDHLEVELINSKDGSIVFSSKTIPIPSVSSSRLYRLNAKNNSTNSTNAPTNSPSNPTGTPSPGGGGGGGIVPNAGERYAYTTIKCPPMNAMFTGKVSVVMKDGERSAVPGTASGRTPDPEALAYVMISYTSCYSSMYCYGYSCASTRGCGSENVPKQLNPTGDNGNNFFLSLDGKEICIEDYRGNQQCKAAVVGAYLSAQTDQISSPENSYSSTDSFSITSIVKEKNIRDNVCNGKNEDSSLSSTIAVNVGLLLVALICVALL